MTDHSSIFSFLSAAALLGVHEKPATKQSKKVIPTSPVKRPETQPENDPADCGSASEDVAESCFSPSSIMAPKRSHPMVQNRPLKSILKPVSSYGPAGAKNPKSLSRGFQSMMEFPTSLPEEAPCSQFANLDLSAHSDLSEEEEEHSAKAPGLTRSVSFNEAEEKFELLHSEQDLTQKKDLWFQKHEIGGFVQNEMSRRRTLGIKSTNMLCAQAHSIDDEEVFKRRLAANMPKGVRR